MMRAVVQLSPVSMWQARPEACSAATTPAASGLTGSATASAASSLRWKHAGNPGDWTWLNVFG